MLSSLFIFVIFSIAQMQCKLLFASTPIQIVNGSYDNYGNAQYQNISTMSVDNDIISIHEDCNWGVPWNAFWNGTVREDLISPTWKQHMHDTLTLIKTVYDNKPIFISFGTLNNGNPGRSCPARNVTYDRGQEDFSDCQGCYDFNETRNEQALFVKNGFIAYVLYFINYFTTNNVEVKYVNQCTESNFYAEGNVCGTDKWNSVKSFCNDIYDAIKLKWPDITMVPSFQVEAFRGQLTPTQACYNKTDVTPCVEQSFQLIEGYKYDIFGLSTYPYTPTYIHPGSFKDSDYLTVILDRLPNDTIFAIAETGFVTSDIYFNYDKMDPQCFTQYSSNISRAMDWMSYIGNEIVPKYNFELFTWFSNSNFEPLSFALECPCKLEDDPLGNEYFCRDYWEMIEAGGHHYKWSGAVFAKVFATMGLREYDHSPKSGLYDLWMQLQNK